MVREVHCAPVEDSGVNPNGTTHPWVGEEVRPEERLERRVAGVQTRERTEHERGGGERHFVAVRPEDGVNAQEPCRRAGDAVVGGCEAVNDLVPGRCAGQDDLDEDGEGVHVAEAARQKCRTALSRKSQTKMATTNGTV